MSLDFDGFGIPPGRYALPDFGELLRLHGDDTAAAIATEQRLQQHLKGELPLAIFEPAEYAFLREHFADQVADNRERALAHFNMRVPRRFAAAQPDEAANDWARSVIRDPHGTRSLLLVGPVGVGKTHHAWATLRAVAQTGSPTRWLSYAAADLYAHLRPHSERDSETEFDKVAAAGLLLLDDLGAAKLTEWTEEITYRLINSRYEQCLPSIFTSNVPPGQLADILGARVASRLAEMCDRVAIKGADRRRNGGAAA